MYHRGDVRSLCRKSSEPEDAIASPWRLVLLSLAAAGCSLLDLSDLGEGTTASASAASVSAASASATSGETVAASSVSSTSSGGGGGGGEGGSGGGAPASAHTLVVVGGRVTTTMPEDTIFTAAIADDGSLSEFVTQHMPFVRQNHGIAAVGGHLFVFGGFGASGDTDDVQRAQIGPAATFDGWSANPAPLPMAFGRFGVAVRGDDVYVTGGRPNSAGIYTDGVFRGTVSAGALGLLTSIEALPTAKSDDAAVIAGDRLIVIGGSMTGEVSLDEVSAFPIDPTGGLGVPDVWPPLAVPRAQHCAASTTIGGTAWIYVVGGQSATSQLEGSIEVAKVEGSTIGAWTVAPQTIGPRRALACAAFGTSLYVIGGVPVGAASTPEVLRVELDPIDGMPLSIFVEPPLPEARAFVPALILAQ